MKMKIGVVATFIAFLFSLPTANAVTFGQEEINASTKFPWAVPILYYERDGLKPAGLCTGTLIRSDVVLTAAHCIPSDGYFEVKYGVTSLEDAGKTYTVNATWVHPRYSKSKFGVNDIGLLKLKEQIPGAVSLPLASQKIIKLSEASKDIRILGWGEDQNGEVATYLRSAQLANQSSFLSRLLGKKFNKNTWVAAGKYNSIEKVYAGGCSGDSGGPLVGKYKGEYVQIGITSFGAENCETEVPTIFMKTGYFASEINNAVNQLSLNAVVNDRSPAENVTPPSILGNIRIGTPVTCFAGQWSPNVSTFSYKWETLDGVSISTDKVLVLADSLAGQTIRCSVTGSSRASSLSKSVELKVPDRLTVLTQATIIGLPKSGYDVGTTNNLSCQAGTTSGQIESSSFSWIVRNSTYDTSGTNLGNSQSLNLPSSFFQTNNLKDLVCVNTLFGPGGTVRAQANGTIYAPQVPSIYSVSYSGFNSYSGSNADAWIGTNLVCSASSSLPSSSSTRISYSWKLFESLSSYTPTDASVGKVIGAGTSLTLTESLLREAVLKRIGCVASVTTLAGTATGYSSVFYVDYRNIATADLTPPTFSFISISPFNGPSFRLRDPFTIVFTAGDSSGLSAYPTSFRAILNGTKEISLSRNGNQYAYPGGTVTNTKYEQSFILPGTANGGELGSYQIFIGLFDSKGNYTGWQPLTSFEVTGERTN
jgi:V8-like Glu-specific endopeptidase